MISAKPYSALARIYDQVMAHVDYRRWVDYTWQVLNAGGMEKRLKPPLHLLECACGTGTLALLLAREGCRVEAFDQSEAMVAIALKKCHNIDNPPHFFKADYGSFQIDSLVEATLCLFDSVNYILTTEACEQFFQQVRRCTIPGGLFFFVICTEINSLRFFNQKRDYGQGPGFTYTREMTYRTSQRLQENKFIISFDDLPRKVFQECHFQRIYSAEEIIVSLKRTGWQLISQYADWTLKPPEPSSLRIHFLVRRQGG